MVTTQRTDIHPPPVTAAWLVQSADAESHTVPAPGRLGRAGSSPFALVSSLWGWVSHSTLGLDQYPELMWWITARADDPLHQGAAKSGHPAVHRCTDGGG